ncbi:hypothetical protein ACIBKZ_33385 [Streptomyces sp. NPDC050421]|uniref:hypothetical protein n=1 Tax=unclassified Streptomyces TaxID=2593676 RepID=UPI0037B59E76
MEFKLFGKHIAGAPAPLTPDRVALKAYKKGLTVHERVAVGGIHNPEKLITRVEMAGWKLQFREVHPAGDRTHLTFRRVGA